MSSPFPPRFSRKSPRPARLASLAAGLTLSASLALPAVFGGDSDVVAPSQEAAKLANVPKETIAPKLHPASDLDPIARAQRLMAECQARYAKVQDYTCTFFKRERLEDGRLTGQNVMHMKYRAKPASVYFKFVKPLAGREAIYVTGRHSGKALVHDVGIGKLLAGTLSLDPKGSLAMEGCRHPITDAGIGHMIEEIVQRWKAEMRHGETIVDIQPSVLVGARPCTMIESTHSRQQVDFLFHKVKVYIDHEHGLPIRFEAYDWPKHPGAAPELMEEYTYNNLRVNAGLTERDFDPANKQYSFGRF